MTIKEACRLLEIEGGESFRDIRKKYLRLMKENHPDNQNSLSCKDARLLNEAYHLVIASEAVPFPEKDGIWDAKEKPQAFCGRTVYFQHVFSDGMVHQIPMAYGKYLWNPDAEEFSMLMKSVYEAAHEAAGTEDVVLFHSLMQEFIDPLYALEHIPKPWIFRCSGVLQWDHSKIVCSASRLYACLDDGIRNVISFQDKSLNYVVTPLIQSGSAAAELQDGKLKVVLTGKSLMRDYAGMNALIERRLQKLRRS